MRQISIIGLGQIGTSAGLAWKPYADSILRVGYDREPAHARLAKSINAVQKTARTLAEAVEQADVIILAIPIHEIQDVMERMSSFLKTGAIVADTSPLKGIVSRWGEKYLPTGVKYVGLTPVVNPAYLQSTAHGIEAAREDLFEGGVMAVVSGKGADSKSIEAITQLVEMLGAAPFYVDSMEIDGLMSMTDTAPRMMAAALLNATITKPGWREGRKIAGQAYSLVTSPLVPEEEPASLASSAVYNHQNVVRVLENVINTLREMQKMVGDQDEDALKDYVGEARAGLELWWKDRRKGDWAAEERGPIQEKITMRTIFGDMLGFGPMRKGPSNRDE